MESCSRAASCLKEVAESAQTDPDVYNIIHEQVNIERFSNECQRIIDQIKKIGESN